MGVQISAYCYSPVGMAGVQTIAYELADALPDQHLQVFVPAGGGGLTLAVAKGFDRVKARAAINCVQPAGNDTIASPLRAGRYEAVQIMSSATTISGLQVPNVLDGDAVIDACRISGGNGFIATEASTGVNIAGQRPLNAFFIYFILFVNACFLCNLSIPLLRSDSG